MELPRSESSRALIRFYKVLWRGVIKVFCGLWVLVWPALGRSFGFCLKARKPAIPKSSTPGRAMKEAANQDQSLVEEAPT